MEEWLRLATRYGVVVIDAMPLIVVAFGTADAFPTGLSAAFPAATASRRFRHLRDGHRRAAGRDLAGPPVV